MSHPNKPPPRTSITWRPSLLSWMRAHARAREITLSQAVMELVERERERERTQKDGER
jgi:hypothetical protein